MRRYEYADIAKAHAGTQIEFGADGLSSSPDGLAHDGTGKFKARPGEDRVRPPKVAGRMDEFAHPQIIDYDDDPDNPMDPEGYAIGPGSVQLPQVSSKANPKKPEDDDESNEDNSATQPGDNEVSAMTGMVHKIVDSYGDAPINAPFKNDNRPDGDAPLGGGPFPHKATPEEIQGDSPGAGTHASEDAKKGSLPPWLQKKGDDKDDDGDNDKKGSKNDPDKKSDSKSKASYELSRRISGRVQY